MWSYTPTVIGLFLLSYIPSAASQGASATILEGSDYKNGRPCMRNCVYYLGRNIGCDQYIDGCWCRADLQTVATNYLSTCIMSDCDQRTVDLSSGISIYQSYCAGKASVGVPIVTPVATQQVVETTTIERQTVEVTATVTSTTFSTQVVAGVATSTVITGTITTMAPTTVTQVVWNTFSTVINGTESLQQTIDWLGGGSKGLTTQGKVAIALGVTTGVAGLALLVTLCCCWSRRSELKRWKERTQPVGGNEGWSGAHT
ncbi:hypothetical protein DRE_04336 [Drechslerella stenobrocha 248]|uniref:Extracellular membrane protein CFEM domain-containing protein n=1 Tax=Drechslerella stenobrocha 248 TaxID=1043628 RepID=W7I261_9PEZI|nr:hypothetical protein DRE_04336 [Drechslerella stenobrocha 248]